MFRLLIFITAIKLCSGQLGCIENFDLTTVKNVQYCLGYFTDAVTREAAAISCSSKHTGCSLVDIESDEMNKEVSTKAGSLNMDPWLGIKCANNVCQTDAGTITNYRQFSAEGLEDGVDCVQLNNKQTMQNWQSEFCKRNHGYVCQYNPDQVDSCPLGYEEYNNVCYRAFLGRPSSSPYDIFEYSEGQCQAEGGHLVSIHSNEENTVVFDLTNQLTNHAAEYALIGLHNRMNPTWRDGTQYNFNWTSGVLDSTGGDCFVMRTQNNTHPKKPAGWTQIECTDEAIPYVCKRGKGTVPITNECPDYDENLYHEGITISSPGYPGTYGISQGCEYEISVSPDKLAALQFSYLNLDCDSFILFYSTKTSSSAFRNLTCADDFTAPLVSSTTREMKMKFISKKGGASALNSWTAQVVAEATDPVTPPECPDDGSVYHEGYTISSPGYPGTYGINQGCEYEISVSPDKLAALQFSYLNLDCDSFILLYLTKTSSSPFRTLTCNDNRFTAPLIISMTREMKMKFISKNGGASAVNRWTAQVEAEASDPVGPNGRVCSRNVDLWANGTFSTPYYPISPTLGSTTSYLLGTSGSRMRIVFDGKYINSEDILKVFDGCNATSTRNWRVTNDPSTWTVDSSNNRLFVRLVMGDIHNTYGGFSASFYTIL